MAADDPGGYLITTLPFAVQVDGECLGTASPSNIGSAAVSVLTPTLRRHEGDSMFMYGVAPPIPGLVNDINWTDYLHASHPWVSPDRWSGNGNPFGAGDVASLKHVVIHTPASKNPDLESAALSVLDFDAAWAERVGDWIEVVAQGWLHRPALHGDLTQRIGHRPSWIFDGQRSDSFQQKNAVAGVVRLSSSPGLPLSQWQAALRLAGEGRVLPTEYVFLRDARGWLARNELRRAVLDAATSAEIAAAKLLDAHTAPAGPAIAEAIRDANKDLGRMSSTLRKTFNIEIPQTMQAGLIAPRNRAIHAGVGPDHKVAETAIALASALVEMATPLSTLIA